ncbi:uncharacterized protein LOC105700378 [Orussus abietinus]|uniref:uncharacterized protein LOC105700378 n=1 Tax=Orussus abietinus TaxID=222816 RepID=UPI000625AF4C|nr:uncharacterized protein LOC105700378 [Orussus abietinus]XP_023290259.1 uncharacterized protein LOC105700378 [Orussus abietinus]XP_023290260.1 uncharacterized protein LOC105700378 [Orussus abietinus]
MTTGQIRQIIETIYDRCLYRGCKNGPIYNGYRLFRFPAPEDPRQKIWIKNCGNKRLQIWSGLSIRRAGLCKNHFRPESFTKYSPNGRLRLKRKSIPIPFEEAEELRRQKQAEEVRAVELHFEKTEELLRQKQAEEARAVAEKAALIKEEQMHPDVSVKVEDYEILTEETIEIEEIIPSSSEETGQQIKNEFIEKSTTKNSAVEKCVIEKPEIETYTILDQQSEQLSSISQSTRPKHEIPDKKKEVVYLVKAIRDIRRQLKQSQYSKKMLQMQLNKILKENNHLRTNKYISTDEHLRR